MSNRDDTKKFGLFTVVMMIVGVVIGSGIFFKSSTILVATNGSIILGIAVFCVAAISIIFGSLTIAQLAARTEETGGLISYATNEISPYAGCVFGWYHFFLAYSATVGVVGWIATIYIESVFGLDFSLEQRLLATFLVITVCCLINIFASKVASLFQTSAAIIKLIPLILIAILGFVFGDFDNFATTTGQIVEGQKLGWFSAICPIAFAYEGWIVATTLTHKIKNPAQNLPIALILSPLVILVVYIAYFVGISLYVGPEQMMAMGESHMLYAATNLFGAFGGKLVVVAVLISVLGTLNGNTMALVQLPYSLSLRGMFPKSDKFSKINKKFDSPVASGLLGFFVSCIWLILNYIDKKYQILGNSDICEVVVVVHYLLCIMLYVKVIQLTKNKEIEGVFKGYIAPIMAIVGSGVMLFGGLQSPTFIYMFVVCILVILSALLFWSKASKKI
ncbi:MAG: APC family permease [Oscillospiraceae bacterium]|nr:APC family permease [Oscillospiraceae bacterium]